MCPGQTLAFSLRDEFGHATFPILGGKGSHGSGQARTAVSASARAVGSPSCLCVGASADAGFFLVRGMAKKPKLWPQLHQVYLPPPVRAGSSEALTLTFRLMSGAVLGTCTVGVPSCDYNFEVLSKLLRPRAEAAAHQDHACAEGTP